MAQKSRAREGSCVEKGCDGGGEGAMSDTLDDLLAKAKAAYDAMSPEERDAMNKAQCESFVRAEMGWPKPKYKWVNGVKVYESYEDYCNG